MDIIIVGDGRVGYTLAEHLSRENHSVTIIDKNPDVLIKAADLLDVMTIRGSGTSMSVLKSANVGSAGVLIAATTNDEMNMVCCLAAKMLGARHTIARIRDPEYANDLDMLTEQIGLDMSINPEKATALYISRLLRFPSASNVQTFQNGRVEMISLRLREGDFLIGKELKHLRGSLPRLLLIAALHRREGGAEIPRGDTVLKEGDTAYIVGVPASLAKLLKQLGRDESRIRDVMIVGGGLVARYLCEMLPKSGIRVKLIEINPDRARKLAELLPDCMVICGDGTDQALLDDERLDQTGAFVALTDRGEANVMTALYAHSLGVGKLVAKADSAINTRVAQLMGIDGIVSPKAITAAHILQYVRGLSNSAAQGEMLTLYPIVDGAAEVSEFRLTADTPYIKLPLKSIPLRRNILLAAILRRERMIIPDGATTYVPGDSVIVISKGEPLKSFNEVFT